MVQHLRSQHRNLHTFFDVSFLLIYSHVQGVTECTCMQTPVQRRQAYNKSLISCILCSEIDLYTRAEQNANEDQASSHLCPIDLMRALRRRSSQRTWHVVAPVFERTTLCVHCAWTDASSLCFDSCTWVDQECVDSRQLAPPPSSCSKFVCL